MQQKFQKQIQDTTEFQEQRQQTTTTKSNKKVEDFTREHENGRGFRLQSAPSAGSSTSRTPSPAETAVKMEALWDQEDGAGTEMGGIRVVGGGRRRSPPRIGVGERKARGGGGGGDFGDLGILGVGMGNFVEDGGSKGAGCHFIPMLRGENIFFYPYYYYYYF